MEKVVAKKEAKRVSRRRAEVDDDGNEEAEEAHRSPVLTLHNQTCRHRQ